MVNRIFKSASVLSVLALLPARTQATVTFYDNLAAFQSVSNSSVAVTFDPFTPTDTNISPTLTLNGITFASLDTSNLYVASPAKNLFGAPNTSNVLTSSGNEHFDISLSSAAQAVGFDTYTNFSTIKPIFTVYDTANNLIGTYTLTQSADTFGFIGVTSDIPIGKVDWLAHQGETQDTGIDNVRFVKAGAVPEPGSLALLTGAAFFGGSLLLRRRRK